MLIESSCEDSADAGNAQVTVENVDIKMGIEEEQCPTEVTTSAHQGQPSTPTGGGCGSISTNSSPHMSCSRSTSGRPANISMQDSVKAIERAHEIISGLGRHETLQSGSRKEAKALIEEASPSAGSSRFDRLYADGAERAERLAVAQAQKRMDELLEGPGSATGKMYNAMKRGDKSPNSTASGPCQKNQRFERLYAEGAERAARRKDLEESVLREEDEKLRMEIAKAKKTRHGAATGTKGVSGNEKGLWERMSRQEAEARAAKLQKLKEEVAEKERQEIEATKFRPPSVPKARGALANTSVMSVSSAATGGVSVNEVIERMSKNAVDSRRARLEQLSQQYSAEEKARIDATRFKKSTKSKAAGEVNIRKTTDRLYAEGEKRRAKLEQMQEEAELKEIAKCQGFRPKITHEGSAFQPPSRVKRAGEVDKDKPESATNRKSFGHQRLYAESQARKERIEKLAKAMKAEEDKECTYQPNLRKSLGRYKPSSVTNSSLGAMRSPMGGRSVHENLYRERATRDERIRKMREEKEALEVSSLASSRVTPKTPTRRDIHITLHDEVYRKKAESEARELEKEEIVQNFLEATRRTPARPGLHNRLFEESKLRHDALMKKVKAKEDDEAAAVNNRRGVAAPMKVARSMGLPSASALQKSSAPTTRRARSCDSTLASRRGAPRPQIKTDPISLGLQGQTRLPEVFCIGTPDVTPDSSSRSSRARSAEGQRKPQKITLGYAEEVTIPKRKKPAVETVIDHPTPEADMSISILAKEVVSDIITVVQEKTVIISN